MRLCGAKQVFLLNLDTVFHRTIAEFSPVWQEIHLWVWNGVAHPPIDDRNPWLAPWMNSTMLATLPRSGCSSGPRHFSVTA